MEEVTFDLGLKVCVRGHLGHKQRPRDASGHGMIWCRSGVLWKVEEVVTKGELLDMRRE